jgi:hypothetical protein
MIKGIEILFGKRNRNKTEFTYIELVYFLKIVLAVKDIFI